MYDVNPVPYGDELSLNVNETDNMISVPLAIETAPRFGIESQKAKEIAAGILDTVRSNWETLAAKYGISRADIEDMRPAFSESYK